jgi:hypothetical protein
MTVRDQSQCQPWLGDSQDGCENEAVCCRPASGLHVVVVVVVVVYMCVYTHVSTCKLSGEGLLVF